MHSKYVLLIAGAAALTAAGIVACGGGGSPVTPPTVAPPTTTTTTTQPVLTNPGCYPSPPPLYGINVWIQANGDGYRRTLDSRPWVVNMNGFCGGAGFAPTSRFCRTRTEGAPDMIECDQAAVGIARDTGRWGPTWYYQGQLCSGSDPGCTNHSTNQFLLKTRGSGTFTACVADNIPLSQDPSLPGSRCFDCTLREGSTLCE
jgi:hypothetical protein